MHFYIGLDSTDSLNSPSGRALLERIFDQANVKYTIYSFDLPPGQICEIWRQLANHAYVDGRVRQTTAPDSDCMGHDISGCLPVIIRPNSHA
jgi:hypothetical protein